jgi:polysaccharide deacetylase family protein (PEP-CTERM system associated)
VGRRALLSIDLEDWNQLAGRQLNADGWEKPSVAFERQVDSVLALLDSLDAKATFFVLGMTAQKHHFLLRQIAAAGHPLACHGYSHEPIFKQTEDRFREDVRSCIDLLGEAAGVRPRGYRAPAFSMNPSTPWAYEVLADLGFQYDSSQNDSPRIRNRLKPPHRGPFDLVLPSGRILREFPLAVSELGPVSIPVGGGTYWRVLPAALIKRGLRQLSEQGADPALYFHPYEFDSDGLRAPHGPSRFAALLLELRYNLRLSAIARLLTSLSAEFQLQPYEDCLDERPRFGSATLSRTGEYI